MLSLKLCRLLHRPTLCVNFPLSVCCPFLPNLQTHPLLGCTCQLGHGHACTSAVFTVPRMLSARRRTCIFIAASRRPCQHGSKMHGHCKSTRHKQPQPHIQNYINPCRFGVLQQHIVLGAPCVQASSCWAGPPASLQHRPACCAQPRVLLCSKQPTLARHNAAPLGRPARRARSAAKGLPRGGEAARQRRVAGGSRGGRIPGAAQLSALLGGQAHGHHSEARGRCQALQHSERVACRTVPARVNRAWLEPWKRGAAARPSSTASAWPAGR